MVTLIGLAYSLLGWRLPQMFMLHRSGAQLPWDIWVWEVGYPYPWYVTIFILLTNDNPRSFELWPLLFLQGFFSQVFLASKLVSLS